MDFLTGIMQGFAICFSWTNLLYCFIGVFVGTLIGVLPGIGPVGTISLLLPATFNLQPVSAILCLQESTTEPCTEGRPHPYS